MWIGRVSKLLQVHDTSGADVAALRLRLVLNSEAVRVSHAAGGRQVAGEGEECVAIGAAMDLAEKVRSACAWTNSSGPSSLRRRDGIPNPGRSGGLGAEAVVTVVSSLVPLGSRSPQCYSATVSLPGGFATMTVWGGPRCATERSRQRPVTQALAEPDPQVDQLCRRIRLPMSLPSSSRCCARWGSKDGHA